MAPDSIERDDPTAEGPMVGEPVDEGAQTEQGTAWLSPRARARIAYAAKAFTVTALVAGAGVMIAGAMRHKRTRPDHRVDLSVWNVLDRPQWATLDDVREIRSDSGLDGRSMPLYDRSAGRWRHYEGHLAPLVEALGDTLEG